MVNSELVAFRQMLHQHPEVGGQEVNTQRRILQQLEKFSPTSVITVGGTGVLATYDSGVAGPAILLRGDIDALPIQEVNTFSYASTTAGVSHKCGHDGHATIVMAVAALLHEKPLAKGKAFLLFQPSEENGMGARAVLEDPQFSTIQPDFAVALHNLPGYPLGQLVVRKGSFTPAVTSPIIKFHGKTAHAAEPEFGDNPAVAMAELTLQLNTMSQPDMSRDDFRLLAFVHTVLGEEAYGISADSGEIHLTVRAWTNAVLENFVAEIHSQAKTIAAKHNLRVTFDVTQEFFANQNDDAVVDLIVAAGEALNMDTHWRKTPNRWGEDFGLFTERFPAAMFGLGSGENCPALHNPDYDFPDDLIEIGGKLFYEIIRRGVEG
ncbi:MAG: amidohydrolase [Schleiferiaceae bacterium]|nr:amidohydrolase [Schleiferiaceae bacterium]